MITRIIVAAVFGPLIILLSYLGGWWLLGMILLFAAIGILEYLSHSVPAKSYFLFGLTLLYVICLILCSALISFSLTLLIFITYFLLIGMVLAIRNEPPTDLFNIMIHLIWGTAYVSLLYPFVYHIRELTGTGDWLLFLFGTLWLSDSMAMWIGRAFGKRKLAPTVSPGKTIAGFVGGMTGGIIVAFILGYWRLHDYSIINLILAGLLVSFVGQLGDLVESCWKRSIGIKDSSSIIPGHGGVLDRFDSLLFASPVLFLYLKYFMFN